MSAVRLTAGNMHLASLLRQSAMCLAVCTEHEIGALGTVFRKLDRATTGICIAVTQPLTHER